MSVASNRPEPTAVEHFVAPDELFFSTTDRRGVIRSANSVFVRIAGYDHEHLVGRPHNIVRHPSMPSGAFHVMWQRLLAGQPMAAYVRNLAADGGSYWVFATITPFGDGFLSVRSAPLTTMFDTVRDVYARVLAAEQQHAADGHHRAEVARHGATLIEREVRRLGYPSYEALMYDALALEVAERNAIVRPHTDRPEATGDAAEVLDAVREMHHALDGLDQHIVRYADLVGRIAPVSIELLDNARELEAIAEHAADVSEQSEAATLRNSARVMRHPMHEAVVALELLAADLGEVLHALRRERFSISVARLHAEMTGVFAAESVDGLAPEDSLGEVPALSTAMADDVREMLAGSSSLNGRLHTVAERVRSAHELTDRFGFFLTEWERMAIRKIPDVPLTPIVGPVEQHLRAGRDQLAQLQQLAEALRAASASFDVTRFETPLSRINALTTPTPA